MSVESPRIRSLLRQADRVADSGKRAAAEDLYRQIIDEAPDTALAWYGLAQVVHDPAGKEAAMQKAEALDPALGQAPAVVSEKSDTVAESPEGSAVDKMAAERPPAFSSDGQNEQGQYSGLAATRADDAVVPEAASSHTHEASRVDAVTPSGTAEALVCANHPGRQTHLRCNRCGKPICSSCANRTPVGYRCPECIREQEDVYFTATPIDYVIAILVALPLSLVAGFLATLLGFWSIFLAAFAGTLIGRVSFRAARRRRGRWLPQAVVACVIIGGVLPALPLLLGVFSGHFSLRLLFTGIYIVMATGATYYQMR